MFCSVASFALGGIEAFPVQVEVDISRQMPSFDIVGLPDAAVKESRDRVKSAFHNAGFTFPTGKIIVNLAPGDMKKSGPLYDMPIFLGILSACGQLDCSLKGMAFAGELSLSGEVRPVHGILSMALKAKEMGLKSFFVPLENAPEGAVSQGIDVYGVPDIHALCDHLSGRKLLSKAVAAQVPPSLQPSLDFKDVKGQAAAKRACEIAAAGGHNLLFIGPPGTGKSMLAKRIPSILPQMTQEQSIETTKIHSVAGILPGNASMVVQRPFRSPHHTVSPAGLSGGGSMPKPGEISLANHGVLFLDELPEFSRSAMEVLRQPMEDGTVTIARAAGRLTYPCNIMVVAAMNPCPCGYFGHPTRKCTCPPNAAHRYIGKVSGPLLDRLDLHIEVSSVEFEHLASKEKEESSASIKKRVEKARQTQAERYMGTGISCNARLTPAMLSHYCTPEPDALALLKTAFQQMGLSARAYDRILKIARTIADLDGSSAIKRSHIAEAIQYRSLDRKYWEK